MEEPFLSCRDDFPILSSQVYGKPLIYLDNAATTQKPRQVVERISQGYYETNANIHRGVHYLSQRATELHESARERVRQFLNARSTEEILFTRGTTEAINLVAFSYGEAFCRPGDEMVITVMEHHSNLVPWQLLCERKQMTLKAVPLTERGDIDMVAFQQLLTERVKLVAVTHVSNVLGTVNPIEQLIQIAHSYGIPVLIDGAQAVSHFKVDVQALDADFYAFSSHKVYGPVGIGVLYGKKQWLDAMPPYQSGGEMIAQSHLNGSTWNELPYKFEAGTPDFIGSTALARALDYIEQLGLERIAAYENDLLAYAEEQLSQIDGFISFGKAARRSAVLSFLLEGIHPFDVGTLLDHLGIAVRTGHHCAQPLMDFLGIDGTVRASFAFYNTPEEVDALYNALKRIKNMF